MANTENRLSTLPQEKKQIEKLELDALRDANEATLQKILDDIRRVLLDNPSKTEVLYAEKFFKNAEILSSRYLSGIYKGQEDARENWQNLSDEYESYKTGRTLAKSLNGKPDSYNTQFIKRPLAVTKTKKDIDPLKGIIKNNEDPESLNAGTLGREDAFINEGRWHASLEGRFSSTRGFSGEWVVSHMFGEKTSGALDIEMGAEQLRTSVTLARNLADGHMGKISVERFQEVGKYMFDSGMIEERTSQHSFGAAYQFKFNKKWLESVEARGYITKAQWKTLSSKEIIIDTPTLFEIYRNDRNIAGGTKTGGDITLGFKTSDTTRIMITGGKEDVRFKNIYSGDAGNRSGFNGKIALEWLFRNRTTITPSIGTSSTEKLNAGVRVTHRLNNDMSVHVDVRNTKYQDNIGGTEKNDMAIAGWLSGTFATPEDRKKIEESAEIYAASMEERRNNPAKARKFMPALDRRPEDIDEAIDAEINKKSSDKKRSAYQEQLLWTEKAAVRESRTITRPDQRTTRTLNINKNLLPTGARVLENTWWDIGVDIVPYNGFASITKNGGVFPNGGEFQLSGTQLIINTALLREPAVGVIDTYVVTINEVGGGQTVVTLEIEKGSVKVKSLNVTRIAPAALDAIPDAFTFVDQTNVALSTPIESAPITVSWINIASAISVSAGGEYSINGGAWTAAAGTVTNGQTVRVRHTSSASNSTATNTTLTIGGVSDVFTTTTEAAPVIDAAPTVAAPTATKTDTTVTVTNHITDADGVQNITYSIYSDAAGTVLVNSNTNWAAFAGLTASTNYWVKTTAETRNGATGAWTFQTSPTLQVTTDAPANVPPTANNFVYGVNIGNTAKTFDWKVLSAAADANGDTLTATVQVQGTHGTFAIAGDNVTYTPAAGYVGSDIATLRISDGQGGTKDITVTVNGIDTNLAPTITNLPNLGASVESGSTTAGKSVTYGDETEWWAGSTVSISASNGATIANITPDMTSYGVKTFDFIAPVNNTLTNPGGGPITVTITYTVTDANGVQTQTTQTVDVAEAVPVPTLTFSPDNGGVPDNDLVSVTEDATTITFHIQTPSSWGNDPSAEVLVQVTNGWKLEVNGTIYTNGQYFTVSDINTAQWTWPNRSWTIRLLKSDDTEVWSKTFTGTGL